MQQKKNCWKMCFLCGPCPGVISRTILEFRELTQSPDSNDVNAEFEEATALGAVTRRQPVKI
jgi:hypothetical protein